MELYCELQKKFYLYKFENELNYLNDSPFDNSTRINKLNNIIDKINNNNVNDKNEKKYDDFFNDVMSDVYLKKWIKLNIIHKKFKLEEYVNKKIKNKNENKKIINHLINMLNNKNINKYIDYNESLGYINNITILKKNEETNSYFISI